jgi:two-component system, NarL family, sensor histidine kinase UhpB
MRPARLIASIRERLARTTLFQRIAVGNALIIVAGAVLGTLVTRHLASRAADWGLILLFATAGVLLSLAVNFAILGAALRPLQDLRRLVEQLDSASAPIDPAHLNNPDPDTIQLAAALNLLVVQLEERNRELHALSERAIHAQEAERVAIARSLHDDTGQALSMLVISLDRLAGHLSPGQDDLKQQLTEARALAANALAELRRILFGLRPAILDDLGLVPAIRWYARSTLEGTGVRVQVQAPQDPLDLPPAVATALFRIAQEAVNNIGRHAAARSAMISLEQTGDQVCLEIQDDGRGFDLQQVSEQALQFQQLGLLGLRERAELLGGRVSIDSSPGRGTHLKVCIPVGHDRAGGPASRVQ